MIITLVRRRRKSSKTAKRKSQKRKSRKRLPRRTTGKRISKRHGVVWQLKTCAKGARMSRVMAKRFSTPISKWTIYLFNAAPPHPLPALLGMFSKIAQDAKMEDKDKEREEDAAKDARTKVKPGALSIWPLKRHWHATETGCLKQRFGCSEGPGHARCREPQSP